MKTKWVFHVRCNAPEQVFTELYHEDLPDEIKMQIEDMGGLLPCAGASPGYWCQRCVWSQSDTYQVFV